VPVAFKEINILLIHPAPSTFPPSRIPLSASLSQTTPTSNPQYNLRLASIIRLVHATRAFTPESHTYLLYTSSSRLHPTNLHELVHAISQPTRACPRHIQSTRTTSSLHEHLSRPHPTYTELVQTTSPTRTCLS